MRFVPLLLVAFSLALLCHCSGGPLHSKPKRPVLTGITEYYHPGSKPSSSSSLTPLPAAPVKKRGWGLFAAPGTTKPSATKSEATYPGGARVRLFGLIHAGSPAVNNGTSTHPPTFANADGTTSKVVGNTLIRSDGTRGDMIGNTVYHANGTTSKIVGDKLINADGSQSSRINDHP